MNTPKKQQDKFISDVVNHISQSLDVEKIYLFGSRAYGTPKPDSDYDFFIVLPDDGMRPIDAMQKARTALRPLNAMVCVDILANYKTKFNERKQHFPLERKIHNEGVVIYDRAGNN